MRCSEPTPRTEPETYFFSYSAAPSSASASAAHCWLQSCRVACSKKKGCFAGPVTCILSTRLTGKESSCCRKGVQNHHIAEEVITVRTTDAKLDAAPHRPALALARSSACPYFCKSSSTSVLRRCRAQPAGLRPCLSSTPVRGRATRGQERDRELHAPPPARARGGVRGGASTLELGGGDALVLAWPRPAIQQQPRALHVALAAC